MKQFRRWLSTCSSSGISIETSPPSKLDFYSQSDFSLQTLPSIPSLQNLAVETSSSLDFSVNRVSLSSLKLLLPFPIGALAVNNNNNLLYAAAGHRIYVYDVDNYKFTLIDTFNDKNPSSGSIKSIVFQSYKIFTAHQDGRIRVWKMQYLSARKKHNLIATLPTVKDRFRRAIFPGNYVTVRRHKKKLWIDHHDTVSSLVQIEANDDNNNNNGNLIISTSWDKTLKIWNVSSSSNGQYRCLQSIDAHDDALNAVAISPDGTIFTASADRRIRVWGRNHMNKYSLMATLEKHKSAVNALALNDDGSILFSGACDRSILVWEREDSANYMAVTGALRGHSRAILCLINIYGLLISGSADRTVRIWRRGFGDRYYCCVTVLDGHLKPVKSVAATVVNGGGAVKVFSGSFDGEIKACEIVISNVLNT